jgi:hypothetical protein
MWYFWCSWMWKKRYPCKAFILESYKKWAKETELGMLDKACIRTPELTLRVPDHFHHPCKAKQQWDFRGPRNVRQIRDLWDFQVLPEASFEMTSLCDITSCSVVEVDRLFRGAYSLMEALNASETSIYFYDIIQRSILDGCHLQTRECLKFCSI